VAQECAAFFISKPTLQRRLWHISTDWQVAISVDIGGTTDIGQNAQNGVIDPQRTSRGKNCRAAQHTVMM
jgi:hypothetical protein